MRFSVRLSSARERILDVFQPVSARLDATAQQHHARHRHRHRNQQRGPVKMADKAEYAPARGDVPGVAAPGLLTAAIQDI